MTRALVGLPPWLWSRCLFSLTPLLISLTPLGAEEVTSVAGRSVAQYAEQLESEDRVVRLRAARSLAPFGAAAGDVLRQACSSMTMRRCDSLLRSNWGESAGTRLRQPSVACVSWPTMNRRRRFAWRPPSRFAATVWTTCTCR